jgi:class 3 adenylate cyclase
VEEYPEVMRGALAAHDQILRGRSSKTAALFFKTIGMPSVRILRSPLAAASAAFDVQKALAGEDWKELGALKVRVALHTGDAEVRGGDYFGPPLNGSRAFLRSDMAIRSW